MKKIVSLILAMVLVLAFAAPAAAITGTINPSTTAVPPYYDIDLVLIETPASALSVLSLQAVAANKAYIKDSLVHFVLYFKTGDMDTITADPFDFMINPAILISSDIVTFQQNTINGYRIDSTGTMLPTVIQGAGLTMGTNDKSMTIPLTIGPMFPTNDIASCVIVGSGVVSAAANGTILAEILGNQNSVKFAPMTLVVEDPVTEPDNLPDDIEDQLLLLSGPIFSGKGVMKYIISAGIAGDVITYTVVIPDGSDPDGNTDGIVIFTASLAQTIASGSSKNLSKIEVVSNAGMLYLVVDQGSTLAGGGTSALKFYQAGINTEVTDAALLAELTATYTGVMNYFGFNYGAAGVLHPIHFGRKLSTFYAYDSAALTLYNSAITIPDADTEVPQTGDAATSIGFVMIALAIVAAAGLAYRKIRA
ncbi:MAG: LPXTG cell wall anchor domain-containing protein [Bacillota bacterium]